MTVATRVRRVDGERLVSRIVALRRFIELVKGSVPAQRLAPAETVIERAGQRLSLSGDHTVVALAGATWPPAVSVTCPPVSPPAQAARANTGRRRQPCIIIAVTARCICNLLPRSAYLTSTI